MAQFRYLTHNNPDPKEDIYPRREFPSSYHGPFRMISNSRLVKCKTHDQNTENDVQVILGRAIFDVLGLYPMNNHTNATLRDIEYE